MVEASARACARFVSSGAVLARNFALQAAGFCRSGHVRLLGVVVLALLLMPSAHVTASEPKDAEPTTDPTAIIRAMLAEPDSKQAAALAAVEISAEEEQQVGKRAAAAFVGYLASHQIRVIQRGRKVDQLGKVVDKVRRCMTQAERYARPTVYIVDSPRFDARVFPGGHLFFFRGLLESIGSEAALVGVIAHELSHLDRGHALQRLKRIKRIAETCRGEWKEMTQQQRLSARAAMAQIWEQPVELRSESQADLDAVRWTYQLGFDPLEMAGLVLKPRNAEVNQRLPGVSFSSSQGAREQRHRAIFKEYERLHKTSPKAELKVGKELNIEYRTSNNER